MNENQSSHARMGFTILEVTSPTLDDLINRQLPGLAQLLADLDRLKARAIRIDGQIIGTGEADYTKGNTFYTLSYKGKTFQLIDVPGIEGDESKYVNMVHEAVAKGHLVFYVNGTNKKPEKATAEKIRAYLRRGTQVCPIINVRGNADAYEFEEDRESLGENDSVANALKQTTDVLKCVLCKDVLLPGLCVQGLIGFASLAMHSQTKQSTIHPSRNKDLVIQQRNYLKHFSSTKAMFEFSQIMEVARVMHAKLDTFKEDIVESNKVKVLELLAENVADLHKTHEGHRTFIDRLNPEFTKYRDSIRSATESFERMITAGRRNLWNNFFNDISAESDEIVEQHFGDNDLITSKINSAFKNRHEKIAMELQKQLDQNLTVMHESLKQAMERLIQDVKRIDFQQNFRVGEESYRPIYHSTNLDMGLGLSDWGEIALNIGGYALAGAEIGSVVPVIGTLIGAVVGSIVGVIVNVIDYIVGKDKRIRKAKAQVRDKIDEVREKFMCGQSGDIQDLMALVRKDVQQNLLNRAEDIYASLTRPLAIIEQQISLMTHIKDRLENMPYGTIQAL